MGLFEKHTTIARSGFLNNFVDYHCHILPGVDDGFKTMEDTLEILRQYEEAGINTVWFTPHIMEDIPNSTEDLKKRFQEVKSAYEGNINLNLASENMLDSIFLQRLESNDFLPLLGNRLLVETSYFNPPMDLNGLLRKIMSKGYFPVLAHPERYIYMDMKQYAELKEMGVLFQLNLMSLFGAYGSKAEADSHKLLEKGYYSLCATDLHSISSFKSLCDTKMKEKFVKMLPR